MMYDMIVKQHRSKTLDTMRAILLIKFVNLVDSWGLDRRRSGPRQGQNRHAKSKHCDDLR